MAIKLVVLMILLVLSCFFSSAETALTVVNKIRIKALAEGGDRRAKRVELINNDYQTMLTTILIGNNVVNLAASSLTTVMVTEFLSSAWIGVGTGVLTFVLLIFGEIVPKTVANAKSEKLALAYSGTILFLIRVLKIVVIIISAISSLVLRLIHVDPKIKTTMTETDLKNYVDVSHEDGVIESDEKKIIYNIFDFDDSVAKDVMIPRIDMCCISEKADYSEILRTFKEDMYTRIPVYEEDNPDNIIGLINIKDMILVKDKENFEISKYLREAYYTYEFKKTNDLLMEMREKAQNVAFVLSEYGATVGMITLEDLLEEIVGEIRDEYDSDEEELIKNIGEKRYLVEANMKLDDINDAISTDLYSENYDSIGGLMIEQLDRLPAYGETVTLPDGTILTARGIKGNRITKVLLNISEKAEKNNQSDDNKLENDEKDADSRNS
ncbi:MAG: HlyC/CorC family transporter [Butyrivibrio sp.]|jgi:CBS domain containing-hemolysin-like protein|nr:HlyC/CorC family transporter [Butyrivibrio sp.]